MPTFKREIEELSQELREMRDSTAAVRGPQFANLVLTIFELLSMQELVHRAAMLIPVEIGKNMTMEMMRLCTSVGQYISAGLDEALVAEATQMAGQMCEKQHQLHEKIMAAAGGDSGA